MTNVHKQIVKLYSHILGKEFKQADRKLNTCIQSGWQSRREGHHHKRPSERDHMHGICTP